MVNKAERHLNIPLSDILLHEEPKQSESKREGDEPNSKTVLDKDDF